MKRNLLALCLLIPFLGFSQKTSLLEKNKLSLEFRLGAVYDHYVKTNYSFSTDLSSNYENDFKPNSILGLYYNINKNLSLGIDLGHGKIYGENDFHYYEGDFEELNFNAKLNFLKIKQLELYGRVANGVIQYQSKRKFFNNTIPINEAKGEALKSSLALGLEYQLKKQYLIVLDATFNRVNDDNFDAWDNNIGNSKYFVTSVGIKYNFKSKTQNRKDEEISYKKEIKRRVESLNKKYEPRLQEIENQISANNERLSKKSIVTETKEVSPKLNHFFFFESSKHLVSVSSLERVVNIADFLKENEDYKVEITGFSDSDAGDILNDELSKESANSLKQYLVLLGINENRISTFYKGETEPLVPNESQINKQLNRRVNLLLLK